LIEARAGERMHVPLESDTLLVVDGLGDARHRQGLRGGKTGSENCEQNQAKMNAEKTERSGHPSTPYPTRYE
jgi:hypothetical protein